MTCNTPFGHKFNLYFSDGPKDLVSHKVRVRQFLVLKGTILMTIKFIKISAHFQDG